MSRRDDCQEQNYDAASRAISVDATARAVALLLQIHLRAVLVTIFLALIESREREVENEAGSTSAKLRYG